MASDLGIFLKTLLESAVFYSFVDAIKLILGAAYLDGNRIGHRWLPGRPRNNAFVIYPMN